MQGLPIIILLLLPLQAAAKPLERQVVERYVELVYDTYSDALKEARQLNAQIESFVLQPRKPAFLEIRAQWIVSRFPYGQSEAFRFYEGPIDDEDGFETWTNAWPIDEAYLDEVEGKPNTGIVASPGQTRPIDEELLFELNEEGGENDICTGYHALEFLLWGQDFYPEGPGKRPYTDFSTQPNAARRRDALLAISRLLVSHLSSLSAEWSNANQNYGTEFLALPTAEALQKMLTGITMLTGFELASERLSVAYHTRDQEDEHSCFSDTTHLDLIANLKGIQNVWTGQYGSRSGPGLVDYASSLDPSLSKEITLAIEESLEAAHTIPPPFDQAVLGSDEAPGRRAILDCIEALEAQAELLAHFAQVVAESTKAAPSH